MRLPEAEARRRAGSSDHGVLCTLRADGRIDAVPACFVVDSDLLAIPVDRIKPKTGAGLQRVRNLEAHPAATFLCEQWDATDWSRLWWVRLRLARSAEGPAAVARLEALLRAKYLQYRDAGFATILTFRIVESSGWSAH